MFEFAYLAALLGAIFCLALIDRRYTLVWWRYKALAARTMVLGVAFFLMWDITGVASGIFFPGDSPFDTGWLLMPGVPVEELFFLILLMYQTLILWESVKRWRRA
jgi:lycopene cyclase domain-containing protein